MYYTHEYSSEQFDNYEDCYDDLVAQSDIDEYYERLSFLEILRKFFLRKTNDEFCNWFEDKIFEVEHQIGTDFITEHEDDEDED